MRIIKFFMGKMVKEIALCFFVFACFSCKKFVQVDAPSTQLITSSVFNNNGTATAAELGIYSKMVTDGNSWVIAQECGMSGDEFKSYSTSISQQEIYTNAMLAVNAPGPWNGLYNYIYQANAIMEGLHNNGDIVPAIEQQLIGRV